MTESWRNRQKSSVAAAGSMAGNEDRDISNGRTTWDLAGRGITPFIVQTKTLVRVNESITTKTGIYPSYPGQTRTYAPLT